MNGSERNAEFIRFLRYSKRSCTEVQSELYVALDKEYRPRNSKMFTNRPDESAVAGLPLVDSSTISRNMKSGKRTTVNPEP